MVLFRGSRTFENWIANIDFPLESVDLCSGCKAHNGFWEAWQAVADELSGKLTAAIKEYSEYKVIFTGHSFGGAMATLGATALRNDGVDIDLVGSLSLSPAHLLFWVWLMLVVYTGLPASRKQSPS